MPYINRRKRNDLDLRYVTPRDPGELTYQLTSDVMRYVRKHGLNFRTISDVIGSLAQTADEFRRRVVHPYEEQKRAENGDVYGLDVDERGNLQV